MCTQIEYSLKYVTAICQFIFGCYLIFVNYNFLCSVNDVILDVNGVNVQGVEHGVAVEALKNSGYSVRLVRIKFFKMFPVYEISLTFMFSCLDNPLNHHKYSSAHVLFKSNNLKL